MTKTIGFVLIVVTFISGCSSNQNIKSSQRSVKFLPEFKPCLESPQVIDPEKTINRIQSGDTLVYLHTYHSISIRTDSMERELIRRKTASYAKQLVNQTYPEMEVLNDSKFQSAAYSEIFVNESYITRLMPYVITGENAYISSPMGQLVGRTPPQSYINKAQQSIEYFTENSDATYQLLIIIRTYPFGDLMKNSLRIYVLDKKLLRLKYYDELEYLCDVRDEQALIKVLHFALGRLNYGKP